MADAGAAEAPSPASKGLRLPLIIGAALFLLAGTGGFFLVRGGLVPLLRPASAPATPADAARTAYSYVALDPLTINLGPGAGSHFLRFSAQLEVEAGTEAEVTRMIPRVMDVLNGYLRAVSVTDLEDRSALVRLRSQMLRRIQLVTGPGRVRDLLVMEFVLN